MIEDDADFADQPAAESVHDTLQRLRARAEARRMLVAQTIDDKTPDEVQQLVQELQVHQIELEMQYEELLRSQAESESLRTQYMDLYDFAPVGYFTLDSHGAIEQLNLYGSQMLGSVRQRLQGRRFLLFVALECRLQFQEFLTLTLLSDHTQVCELQMLREDGRRFWAQLNAIAISEHSGVRHCRIAITDVTRRQEAVQSLQSSEARFRQLFEQSGDAIVLVKDFVIIDCNQAAQTLIGAGEKNQLVGRNITWLTPEMQPSGQCSADMIRQHAAVAMTMGTHRFEWLRYRLNGDLIWLEVSATPIQLHNEPVMYVVWRDITTQRADREQVLREKEFSESLLDNSVDGILAFDRAGTITAWNRVMERNTGLLETDLLGRDILEVFPRYRKSDEGKAIEYVLQGKRIMRPDMPFHERKGHFETYMVPLAGHDEQITGGLIIIRDISDRTRLAEQVTRSRLRRQQEVLSAILSTQEAERKRIAEALHNGVGQLLYAAKLHVDNHPFGASQRTAAMGLLDEAIKATRNISFELTPGILEDFGLKTALEELAKRIPNASLNVHLYLNGLEHSRSKLIETAIYRMVQELLNNIIKHAKAREAYVHVAHEDRQVLISVEDDGQGFDVTPDSPIKGIGLAGIRNRVDLLGGALSIASRPGSGTIVSIEIPLTKGQGGK